MKSTEQLLSLTKPKHKKILIETRTQKSVDLVERYTRRQNRIIKQFNRTHHWSMRKNFFHKKDGTHILLLRGWAHPDTQKELESINTKK